MQAESQAQDPAPKRGCAGSRFLWNKAHLRKVFGSQGAVPVSPHKAFCVAPPVEAGPIPCPTTAAGMGDPACHPATQPPPAWGTRPAILPHTPAWLANIPVYRKQAYIPLSRRRKLSQ